MIRQIFRSATQTLIALVFYSVHAYPVMTSVARRTLFYMEQKGSVVCAASAIEMACWDIKGKALNVPVFQLLGGLYRDKIEAYASDIYWEEEPKKMGENASRVKSLGYQNKSQNLKVCLRLETWVIKKFMLLSL